MTSLLCHSARDSFKFTVSSNNWSQLHFVGTVFRVLNGAGTNTVVQDTGSGRSSVYSKSTEQLTGNKVFIPSACIKLLDLIGKGIY